MLLPRPCPWWDKRRTYTSISFPGLSSERERERRIADHHQTDIEMQHTQQHTKNTTYYEHLHNNSTYKLSEALRDKPFLALNATTKAKILAYLCDELLQNKTVLRQIDASLEHLNQLKKERYLMDMKIRKWVFFFFLFSFASSHYLRSPNNPFFLPGWSFKRKPTFIFYSVVPWYKLFYLWLQYL